MDEEVSIRHPTDHVRAAVRESAFQLPERSGLGSCERNHVHGRKVSLRDVVEKNLAVPGAAAVDGKVIAIRRPEKLRAHIAVGGIPESALGLPGIPEQFVFLRGFFVRKIIDRSLLRLVHLDIRGTPRRTRKTHGRQARASQNKMDLARHTIRLRGLRGCAQGAFRELAIFSATAIPLSSS